ncbi:CLOCK-interacting pacemaker-like [Scomber scombrus]|uniref:CLOCK-interacting pacemaker-like n=1 Tax=Scomber scombrus TaxID=13677 RepID=UPI002DD8FC31|nr:CLOCK-interacting pacemaker-like [Scomber scombrus]XP_062274425.1 CLOCK-interacting pacemaker-like [Scomber scombrus]XP_062274426.1 CLOCK-interacting pacemaker-like [Scomber scombrus]XP_062274427.1 CLOCK-interacting pacemaker-like [Scomber scombrus]
MPKEEPSFSERSPCVTSSKNAKDKSNNSTMLAIRDTDGTDNSSVRGSCWSSEKDSGYSDNGSDWQQTDVEDHRGNRSQSRGSAETSQSDQSQEHGQGNSGNPTLMSAGCELSRIYVINNMPAMIQNRSQLLWRNRSRETGGAHMIQTASMQTNTQHHRPSSQKTNVTGKKISGTYLPILKSYPRIAPHPSKKQPDKTSSNDDSQNLSKRLCTKHESDHTPVTGNLLHQHLCKQPKLAVRTSGQPCASSTTDILSFSSPAAASSSMTSTSVSSQCTTSSFHATRGLHRNRITSTRHRRFLNTVEILKQSGLLDITLHTKELLRQSNATDRDIAQLRLHTELLCQAVRNPSCSLNGIMAWENLHRAMAESGRYPNLNIMQNLQTLSHPDSASKPESVTTGDASRPLTAEDSGMLQAPLLTTRSEPSQRCPVPQQSHTEQHREPEASKESSDKDTFMPPDSSTD